MTSAAGRSGAPEIDLNYVQDSLSKRRNALI